VAIGHVRRSGGHRVRPPSQKAVFVAQRAVNFVFTHDAGDLVRGSRDISAPRDRSYAGADDGGRSYGKCAADEWRSFNQQHAGVTFVSSGSCSPKSRPAE
jgi:hypothetical protein